MHHSEPGRSRDQLDRLLTPFPYPYAEIMFIHSHLDTITTQGVRINRTIAIGESGYGQGRHAVVLDIPARRVEVTICSPSKTLALHLASTIDPN